MASVGISQNDSSIFVVKYVDEGRSPPRLFVRMRCEVERPSAYKLTTKIGRRVNSSFPPILLWFPHGVD
ncbi:Protein of unknown function [Pyronema omphalodes CBS 100304]|uniref:Uncharacterized protein n=1 Tax=Pyronema omphalodes (strain CBS 100304) TaxID=1076935 RepID=U4LWJ8_PYROM|nr:Protein of unknown function [Pyronema omphalodes CBS 100304]